MGRMKPGPLVPWRRTDRFGPGCWILGFTLFAAVLVHLPPARAAEKWSFAAIADIHAAHASYRNVLDELQSPTIAREERGEPPDFVMVLGDFSPVSANYTIFERTFRRPLPLFLPARGNHEKKQDLQVIDERILPAAAVVGAALHRYSPKSLSYWVDWKGARVIFLDQYADFKKNAASPTALQWLRQALGSARSADHIFVGFHEPFFPWETEEDPLWSILLEYRTDIRAVLFGHTHVYFRSRFPDLLRGIPVINVGNAGQNTHSDLRQTIVCVIVEGKSARVATLQTPDGQRAFRLADSFNLYKP